MKKVILFFANGTEEIEALTALDLLRRAGAEVTLAGVGGKELTGSHAIRITADIDAAEIASLINWRCFFSVREVSVGWLSVRTQ